MSAYRTKSSRARFVSATRIFTRLIFALTLLIALDYFVFSYLRLVDAADEPRLVRSEALVVFSGDPSRIKRGFELLARGDAPRLFIAGLDNSKDIDAERNKRIALYKCCVENETFSRNTHEDARAIAKWTQSKGISSLIVVTTNIHMPRALLELSEMIPTVRLNPAGVSQGLYDSRDWRRNAASWPELSRECIKYAIIRLSNLLHYASLSGATNL